MEEGLGPSAPGAGKLHMVRAGGGEEHPQLLDVLGLEWSGEGNEEEGRDREEEAGFS